MQPRRLRGTKHQKKQILQNQGTPPQSQLDWIGMVRFEEFSEERERGREVEEVLVEGGLVRGWWEGIVLEIFFDADPG
jgi:hypothetical protein